MCQFIDPVFLHELISSEDLQMFYNYTVFIDVLNMRPSVLQKCRNQ